MPTRRPGARPSHAFQLREQVDVEMGAARQDLVEVGLGQVRAGVADLLGPPPMVERPLEFAGRTHVHADERRAFAQEREELGLALRLQGVPHDGRDPGARERIPQQLGLLAGAFQVVGEQRRAVLAREFLGVTARDRQPPGSDLQARPGPPRSRFTVASSHRHRLAAVRPAVAGFGGLGGGFGVDGLGLDDVFADRGVLQRQHACADAEHAAEAGEPQAQPTPAPSARLTPQTAANVRTTAVTIIKRGHGPADPRVGHQHVGRREREQRDRHRQRELAAASLVPLMSPCHRPTETAYHLDTAPNSPRTPATAPAIPAYDSFADSIEAPFVAPRAHASTQ